MPGYVPDEHASRRSLTGRDDFYVPLIAVAFWIPVVILGRNQPFAFAAATAFTICASLAYGAARKESGNWNSSIAWVIRFAAAATLLWLYTAAPTPDVRFAAGIVFAVLYILCERAVWRRMRKDQSPQRN